MPNEPYNNDVLFDRLVDGELNAAERRKLLASLDKQSEGWRRCALAFLEAQSWRQELGQVARNLQPATKVPSLRLSKAPKTDKSRWADGARWLALAAGLLLAFGIGW